MTKKIGLEGRMLTAPSEAGKTSMNHRLVCTMILASTLFAACAPRTESINHEPNHLHVGPQKPDVDLHLDPDRRVADLTWEAELPSAVILRLSENVLALRDSMNDRERTDWARNLVQSFPSNPQPLISSSYTGIFFDKAEEMARKPIQEIMPVLNAAPEKVKKLLKGVRPAISKGERTSLEESVRRVFRFLREFDSAVKESNLMSAIKSALRARLKKNIELESLALSGVRRVNDSKTILSAIENLKQTLSSLGIALPSETRQMLADVEQMGRSINEFRTTRETLSALIEVWLYLSPSERLAKIKPASPELYDYLNEQSVDDLRCLQSPICLDPTQWLARTLVINPKIEAYGIERIRSMLNSKGAEAVKEQVAVLARNQVRETPTIIADLVASEVRKTQSFIKSIASDLKGDLRNRFERWAERSFDANGPSILNPHPVQGVIKFSSDGTVMLTWAQADSVSPENSGAFDAIAPALWTELADSDPSMARGLMLTAVSALSDQYKGQGEPMPDKLETVSARAYAERVRGFARLAMGFREFQRTPFDKLVGNVMATELYPELDIDDLRTSIFPKSAFFALSFKSLFKNLLSATGKHSQIFVIDANNRVSRASEQRSENDPPPVMAGIADRDGNDLAETVRSEDVARYLIAMADVYESTRGIERTASEYLLEPDKKTGKSPRDEIIKGRQDIKKLVLGLANYLSHQFRAGGEFVVRELVIETQKPVDNQITLVDQMLAVRALVAASDVLGNDLYRWEAADLVSSLNRRYYRRDLGFYARARDTSVSPIVLLEGLRALDSVAPYLPTVSRHQIEALTAPWRVKVSNWRLDASGAGAPQAAGKDQNPADASVRMSSKK